MTQGKYLIGKPSSHSSAAIGPVGGTLRKSQQKAESVFTSLTSHTSFPTSVAEVNIKQSERFQSASQTHQLLDLDTSQRT